MIIWPHKASKTVKLVLDYFSSPLGCCFVLIISPLFLYFSTTSKHRTQEENSGFCFPITLTGLVLISVKFQRKKEQARSTSMLLQKNKAGSGPCLKPGGALSSTVNKNCTYLFSFEPSYKNRKAKRWILKSAIRSSKLLTCQAAA